MIIGLSLLGLVAVLIFFGVASRYFKKIGVANWLAFLAIIALVVGVVVPNIMIGNNFAMNVGAFLIPAVVTIILMFMIGFNNGLLRSIIGLLAVASVSVAVRMLIVPSSYGMGIVVSLLIGFIGGGVAYLIGMTRLATLTAAMGGVVLGDVISSLIYYFVTGASSSVLLGLNHTFDALIIAMVLGAIICEAVALSRKRSATYVTLAANTESAQDHVVEEKVEIYEESEFKDYFDDEDL